MKYDVIIVNYKGKEVLGPTLDSLYASTVQPQHVIIIDNDSADGSEAFIKKTYPTVEYVQTGANIGFGKANNRGIDMTTSPYIFLVNNDLQVEPTCAELLIKALESQEKAAVASPLIYRGWERPAAEVYSYGATISSSGFTLNQEALPKKAGEANCFTGACCMIKRSALGAERFEKRYFLYYEEPELMIRLWKKGFEAIRVPKAECYHLENHGSPAQAVAGLLFRQQYAVPNRWFALGKHWPAALLPYALSLNILHLFYLQLYFLKNKKSGFLPVFYQAPVALMSGIAQRKPGGKPWKQQLIPLSISQLFGAKSAVIKD